MDYCVLPAWFPGIESTIAESTLKSLADTNLPEMLKSAGAVFAGDKQPHPALFQRSDGTLEVWSLPFDLRFAWSDAAKRSLDLGGVSLIEAWRVGNEHPFWNLAGLPGVPLLFGVATDVRWRESRILGVKKPTMRGRIPSTFGGKLTIPGGILGFSDLIQGRSLGEALISGGLRELLQETGIWATPAQVTGTSMCLELQRAKPQCFVVIRFSDESAAPELNPRAVEEAEFARGFSWVEASSEYLEAAQLSG